MNEPQIKPSDQELLDRLVDGELNQAARRELLLRLEAQPDGWRRCALSFLEAQTWRDSLRHRAAAALPPAQPSSTTSVQPPLPASNAADHASLPARQGTRQQRGHGAWQGWSSSWALAAAVLVAFGLGIAVQESWPTDGPGRLPTAGRGPRQELAMSSATRQQSVPTRGPNRQATGGAPARNVTLVVGGNGEQQQLIRVPVHEVAGDSATARDPAWWTDLPAPLSHDEHQHLQRAGQRVEQRRQLYPFRLEDGRSVMVPVDEVEIQPVSFD